MNYKKSLMLPYFCTGKEKKHFALFYSNILEIGISLKTFNFLLINL